MPDTLCAPRVAELSQQRNELTAHRAQLASQAGRDQPGLPTARELQSLAGRLREAIGQAAPGVTKQVLDELIDRVEISPDKHAQPYFRIPNNTKPRPSAGARTTPVRMGSQDVEVAGIEPASLGG